MNRFVGYIVHDPNGRILHFANKREGVEAFCNQTGIDKSFIRQAFIKSPFNETSSGYESPGTNLYEPNQNGLLIEVKKENDES